MARRFFKHVNQRIKKGNMLVWIRKDKANDLTMKSLSHTPLNMGSKRRISMLHFWNFHD